MGYELGVSSLDVRKSELDGDMEPDQDGRIGGEDDTSCCGGCGVNGSLEPVKPATQPEEPVGVEGATVVAENENLGEERAYVPYGWRDCAHTCIHAGDDGL